MSPVEALIFIAAVIITLALLVLALALTGSGAVAELAANVRRNGAARRSSDPLKLRGFTTEGRTAMADRTSSAAYAAMKPSGKRCLNLIEGAVTCGGGAAALSHGQFKAWGMARSSSCYAVKALLALGFVTVEPGKRRTNVFGSVMAGARSMRARRRGWSSWRVKRSRSGRAASRWVPKPPKPMAVERPRVMQRGTPSLPTMPWQDDGR